jgi:hypothetical protein
MAGAWVAASSALRVLGAGLHSFGFTVFFLPLSEDLNLNRTSTSLAFSLARAEGAIEGPIIGHLLDRYGPKRQPNKFRLTSFHRPGCATKYASVSESSRASDLFDQPVKRVFQHFRFDICTVQ